MGNGPSIVPVEKQKELFLKGLLELGTIRRGCAVAHIGRATYYKWMEQDPDFADKVVNTRQEFGEKLEEVIVGIVLDPEAVKRSPVLAITLLNANLPNKYRPTAILQEETARDLLKEWRKAAQNAVKPVSREEENVPVEKQIEEILGKKAEDGEA